MKHILILFTALLMFIGCATDPISISDFLTKSKAPQTTWNVITNNDVPIVKQNKQVLSTLQFVFPKDFHEVSAYISRKHFDNLYVQERHTNFIILATVGYSRPVIKFELKNGKVLIYMLEYSKETPIGILEKCND